MTAGSDRDDFAVLLSQFIDLYDRLEMVAMATDDDREAFDRARRLLAAVSGMRGRVGYLRARIVARAWHAGDLTYEALGEKLGLSRQRINQLMQVAREEGHK